MSDQFTRRGFLETATAVAISAGNGASFDPMPELGQQLGHSILIRTSDPFAKWLEVPYDRWFQSHPAGAASLGVSHRPRSYKAEYKVRLPWTDPIYGNADPFLGSTRNGEIYVTAASANVMMKTLDQGRTWTSFKLDLTPPLQKPDLNSMAQGGIQAFGILRDGTFLLAYQVGPNLCVARSVDSGVSWQQAAVIKPPHYEYAGGVTHGSIVQLADGTALLPVSLYSEGIGSDVGAAELSIFRSKDGGKTWGDRTRVCFFAWEASLLLLPSGRLLIAVRSQRGSNSILPTDSPELAAMAKYGYPKQVSLANSDDGGQTWKGWHKATAGVFDAPGELTRLPDGRLVLIYAHRAPDPLPCGTWAQVSGDEGETWGTEQYVVNSVCPYRPFDWGYSASHILTDGSILTVSGCRGEGWPDRPELNRKNPGTLYAIRWTVPTVAAGVSARKSSA